MKVLILNGSPRKDGNCSIALREIKQIFTESGVDYDEVQVGSMNITGCHAC